MLTPLKMFVKICNTCAQGDTLGGVGTFTKEVVFGAFGKMECLFSIAPDANSWWLAHLSKGEEVRVEMELVEMMLASVY